MAKPKKPIEVVVDRLIAEGQEPITEMKKGKLSQVLLEYEDGYNILFALANEEDVDGVTECGHPIVVGELISHDDGVTLCAACTVKTKIGNEANQVLWRTICAALINGITKYDS